MKYALFIVLLAWQGPAPNKAATESVQKNAANNKSKTPTSATVTGRTTANNNANQSPQHADQANEQSVKIVSAPQILTESKKDPWDKALVLATWMLVFIAGAQIIFLWRTVNATKDNAHAANLNAQALINSERAWIAVTIKGPPDFSDAERIAFIKIKLTIKNPGKTPARIVQITMRPHEVETLDKLYPAKLPEFPDYSSQDSVTLDNKDILIAPQDETNPISAAIMPQTFIKAREGTTSLYIYGFVKYLDTIENAEHETGFCYIYWPENRLGSDTAGFFVAGITPRAYIYST